MNEYVLKFNIKGDVGCFINPFYNNNPSSFNIMTKPSIVGMIGSVLGKRRKECKLENFFSIMSDNISYSIKYNKRYIKKSWCEYAYDIMNDGDKRTTTYNPRFYERLYNLDFDILILYNDTNEYVLNIMTNFINFIRNQKFVYHPYLGMCNMFVDLKYLSLNKIDEKNNGDFYTNGLVTNLLHIEDLNQYKDNIITDSVPIFFKLACHHIINKYKQIFFNINNEKIKGNGDYYVINDECYEFI